MPKFFVKSEQIENEVIHIQGEDVKHIKDVLRLKIGEEIYVGNPEKAENYRCQIVEINPTFVQCNIVEKLASVAEPSIQVTIFQALPKQDKMEWILQKATELGMIGLVPVATKYCVVKLEEKEKRKKQERWQKIVESAAKQSGRDIIPIVAPPVNLVNVIQQVPTFDLFIIAYEKETEHTLKQALQRVENKTAKIGILIGPEGGMAEEEVQSLHEAGATVVTLGKRILRTETVALNILSNILYEFEN